MRWVYAYMQIDDDDLVGRSVAGEEPSVVRSDMHDLMICLAMAPKRAKIYHNK